MSKKVNEDSFLLFLVLALDFCGNFCVIKILFVTVWAESVLVSVRFPGQV